MTTKRTIALAVAALMMLGMLAGTAVAEPKVYLAPDGRAQVSKTNVFGPSCTFANGVGGLGLPIVTGVKKGYWRLQMDLINGTTLEPAELLACGKLNPVARQATMGGVGAACGMSKGYDGEGEIVDENKGYVIKLTNIVWKVTEAGTILATGHAEWEGKETAKGPGKLVAEVNAQGSGCANKTQQPGTHKKPTKATPGATEFSVNGAAEILQGLVAEETPKLNDMPLSEKGEDDNPAFCKDDDEAQCPIYGPKKDA